MFLVAIVLAIVHSLLLAADVLPHYDALLHVPVIVVLARALEERPAVQRRRLTIAYFFLVASALYVHQLRFGYAGRHALVGGVIPWSDAEGFLTNAWRALAGLPFSVAKSNTGMRPLFPMTFAATLAAVGHDVKLALCLYDAVIAVLMGLVATRLGERYGWKAFAGAILVLTWTLRRNGFVLATESVGLIAGLIAFEAFASSLGRDANAVAKGWLLPAGFLVLGLGNMARPGPLFAIPLLLAWLQLRVKSWRLTGACAVAFVLAFSFNVLVVRTTAEPSEQIGGEFPPILYGAMHGEDYTYLAAKHPEVSALSPRERVPGTLRLMGSELRARPWLLLGFLQGAGAFVGSPHGQFSIAFFDPDDANFERVSPWEGAKRAGIYRVLNLVAMAATTLGGIFLAWRGLWRGVRRRRAGEEPDLLAECAQVIFVGALVSACLTPPWITEAAQLQTTTTAFFALLPWAYSGVPNELAPARRRVWGEHLAFVAWLAATYAFVVTRSSTVPSAPCRDDGRAVYVEPSMLVRVRSADQGGYTLARMLVNLGFMKRHNANLVDPLLSVAREGVALETVLDGCSARTSILVGDAATLGALPPGWSFVRATQLDADGRIFQLP